MIQCDHCCTTMQEFGLDWAVSMHKIAAVILLGFDPLLLSGMYLWMYLVTPLQAIRNQEFYYIFFLEYFNQPIIPTL